MRIFTGGLLQPIHLLVILIIVLVIFGPEKLPDIVNSIGKAIKGFKTAMDEPDKKSDVQQDKSENKA